MSNQPWKRSENRKVITWAIKTIFQDDSLYDGDEDEAPPDFKGPMRLVFDNHQLTNWDGVITLNKETVDELHYFADADKRKNKAIPIIGLQKNRLLQLIDFANHTSVDLKTPLESPEDWMNATWAQFRQCGVEVWDKGTTPKTPPTISATSSHTLATKVSMFKRGIKRDPSLFPMLNRDNNCDSWKCSVETQARAQGAFEPLDPNYKPTAAEDKELFAEQQIYLTAAFEKTVKTSMGQSLFREHQPVYDAQSIYKGLADHALKSTGATLDASDLLACLTTIKLGDGKWKGTTKDFILHFQEQVRKCNNCVEKPDELSENVQKSLLENAVNPLADLRRIKEQANQFVAAHGTKGPKSTSLAQHVTLLISSAQSHDKQFEDTRKPNSSRKACSHNIDTNIQDIMHNSTTDGELDVNDLCEINRAAMSPGTRLPKQQWQELSKLPGMQELWLKLSPQAKKITLSASPDDDPVQVNQAFTIPDESTFDVAIGNSIDNHVKANYHTIDVAPAPPAVPDASDDVDEPDLRAMLTECNIPPTDINRILSSSLSNQDDENIDVAVINGKKCIRKINAHNVLYKTSARAHSAKQSLADCGANGGIAGTDVRIISRTGECVDVEGMMKHRENNIELVTCGGVNNTQRGPVIVIMNQHAHAGHGNAIHSSAQLEWFKHKVDNRSVHVGGAQCIQTVDVHVIPLRFRSALAHMPL